MRERGLIVALVVIAGAFFVGTATLPSAKAATLYVGGPGPGNYTTIQAAIDAANPGDVVFVYSGTYNETIVIPKTLSLVGEDPEASIVFGEEHADVVQITASWVNITGFTVKAAVRSYHNSGIRLENARGCLVDNNRVLGYMLGITLETSENNTISNNTIIGEAHGIHIKGSHSNTIRDNVISQKDIGIWLETSNHSVVVNNTVFRVKSGIVLSQSDNVLVSNNSISEGRGGIGIYESKATTVTDNILSNNVGAIGTGRSSEDVLLASNQIEYNLRGIVARSSFNTITNNTVLRNSEMGIRLEVSNNTVVENDIIQNGVGVRTDSDDNWIYHNNFIENTQQACCNNEFSWWHHGYPSGGNHWSEYAGNDSFSGPNQDQAGSDGIGDTPYNIPWCWDHTPSDQEDKYPLMIARPRPPLSPSAPVNLSAVVDFQNVTLTWNPPIYQGDSPVTNYTVYRGDAPDEESFLVELGNVTTYNDTGLTRGQVYYYRVSATSAIGEGPKSKRVSAPMGDVPLAPKNLTAIPGVEQIGLAWLPPDTNASDLPITNYLIYRGTLPGSEIFRTRIGNVTEFTDKSVSPGTTYYFKVSSENARGEGPKSNEANATVPRPPGAPQNLSATAGNQEVRLRWQPPEDDGGSPITNYSVYRRSESGTGLLIEVGNVLTYLDTGLENGVTYYYRVSAKNIVGNGMYSDEVNGTPTYAFRAPQDLIEIPGIENVSLHWTPPTGPGCSSTSGILRAGGIASVSRTGPSPNDSS